MLESQLDEERVVISSQFSTESNRHISMSCWDAVSPKSQHDTSYLIAIFVHDVEKAKIAHLYAEETREHVKIPDGNIQIVILEGCSIDTE
jgi:hypothetical protein